MEMTGRERGDPVKQGKWGKGDKSLHYPHSIKSKFIDVEVKDTQAGIAHAPHIKDADRTST